MIFAGSDLKFRITAIIESFKVADNDFNVVVKNKWGQVKYVVEKDEMFPLSSVNISSFSTTYLT